MRAGEEADAAEIRWARSTVTVSGLTALSRATGFVRVLVVAAVLGTTYLGNTYQSANTVPNLLFELLAAGALQAVLVPTLVEVLDRGDRREAEHVAGSILGLAAVALAAVAAVGMIAAPLVMRVLVAGVDDPEIRDAQVELGTFFLWFFLPQVVLYAAAMVATGVLNARERFALPVFAPVINNVVVIGAYLLFWHLRDGQPPSLDLDTAQKVVLAGGTTLAVLAFCSLPVIAVVRSGFSLRPRLDHRHPAVRRLLRLGGWAAVYLAMTQVVEGTMLFLGNGVEGGVITYQVALTFFMLPHGLFSLPVLTTLYPRLSRQAQAADWTGYAASIVRGGRAIGFFTLPATAAFLALAPPVAQVVLFGETGAADAADVAAVVRGFAPGLVGFGAFLFLTRAFYATGNTKTPALVNVGVAVGGSAAMILAFTVADGDGRVAAMAVAHSVTYLLAAAVMLGLLWRGVLAGRAGLHGLGHGFGIMTGAAVAAGGVMWVVRWALPEGGTVSSAVSAAVAGLVGGAVYLGANRLLSERL